MTEKKLDFFHLEYETLLIQGAYTVYFLILTTILGVSIFPLLGHIILTFNNMHVYHKGWKERKVLSDEAQDL